MSHSLPPGQRFHELSDLLESYANVDFTFSDTAEVPGPALSAYLRIAACSPTRSRTRWSTSRTSDHQWVRPSRTVCAW